MNKIKLFIVENKVFLFFVMFAIFITSISEYMKTHQENISWTIGTYLFGYSKVDHTTRFDAFLHYIWELVVLGAL